MAQCELQIAVSKSAVTKRTASESRPEAIVTNERKLESVRSEVGKFFYAIGAEVMKLPLFAIADDERAGGLKPLNGVEDGFLIKRIHSRIVAVDFLQGVDQRQWPGNAADRFGGNGHRVGDFARYFVPQT